MPSDELISAMAPPTLCLGGTSCGSEIPSGIMPLASPCNPRPMIMVTTSVATAQTIEPITKGRTEMRSIRFLP